MDNDELSKLINWLYGSLHTYILTADQVREQAKQINEQLTAEILEDAQEKGRAYWMWDVHSRLQMIDTQTHTQGVSLDSITLSPIDCYTTMHYLSHDLTDKIGLRESLGSPTRWIPLTLVVGPRHHFVGQGRSTESRHELLGSLSIGYPGQRNVLLDCAWPDKRDSAFYKYLQETFYDEKRYGLL